MSFEFDTTVHGKWLLAGEHSVLRGVPALVFPVPSKTFHLRFYKQADIKTEFSGEHGEDMHMLFWGVVEHAMELLQKPLSKFTGLFKIDNAIPIGSGMGVSAALCAAVSRMLAWQNWISPNQIFEFAKKLEHTFHNESSGVDIAGAVSDCGVIYSLDGGIHPIEQNWHPKWYLSHTDQIGITSKCVKKVKSLWHKNQQLAKRIDDNMHESVNLAIKALKLSEKDGLALLTAAINKAHLCFTQWGLTGGKVEQHINHLLQSGALAAKPTGSGDGGYALSLWSSNPPKSIQASLIPV